MTARAVHWHEGMFLRPHHLQAAQRHIAQLQHTADQWDHPFSWGLRVFDLDRDASPTTASSCAASAPHCATAP